MRRLPLALLPLLLPLLLLPLLLPLLLSLVEGDSRVPIWTANDGTWPFTGKVFVSTPRTFTQASQAFFPKIASPVC